MQTSKNFSDQQPEKLPFPNDGSKLPFSWWRGNDGRIHIEFDEDVVFHYRKNKVERVAGGSINSSGGVHIISNQVLHINPHGRAGNEEDVYAIAGNSEIAEAILEQMEDKVRDPNDPKHLRYQYIHVRGMDRV